MKLHRINAQLLKFWYITINRVDRIFDIVYWPLIDLFVWGFASFYIRQLSEVNLLSMFLGGMILWIFVWRAGQDIAVYILEDFWSKNLYHLYTTPIRLSEHMTAVIVMGLIRSMATFLVMIALAWLMYAFNLFEIPVLMLASAIFLLSLFSWSIGLLVTALIMRFGQRIQVLAWSIVWAIQPFSCVFYPLAALPGWAQAIAAWMPTTAVFENVRAIIFGTPMNYALLGRAVIMDLALLVVMAFLLKASFNHAKRSGLLARGD
ncbi:MAG: ABC transporter permease [Nanoarchaeota archaeon]|nr:ABC transporter permease [Nanoarchaeota archaeon]